MRVLLAMVLFGLFCVGTASAAFAAQMLVVIDAKDSGDAYKLGTMIRADSRVTLLKGAQMSLLSETGRLVVLTGPYDGKADTKGLVAGAADAPSAMQKISRLIAGQNATVATGASRSVGGQSGAQVPPHVSFINVSTGGQKCALSKWPELWRSDSSRSMTLILKNPQGLKTALDWPVGENRVDLPKAFVADGASITASLAGKSIEFILNVHPGGVRNATEAFAWMADKGCSEQAIALLEALRNKAAAN